jgi:protein-tyrosine phosphatase
MAQGLLTRRAAEMGVGRRVRIDSAGISAGMRGKAPDPRAQAQLLKLGIKIRHCRARTVVSRDFGRFDYILGMDGTHMEWLQQRAGEQDRARLALLMDFSTLADQFEVPDPYFENEAGFARVLALLQSGVDGFVASVLEPELQARGVL